MTTRGRPFQRNEPDRLVHGRRRHGDHRRLGCLARLLIPALLSAACGRAAEARVARAAADPPAADISWPTFGGNPAHESVNLNEKVIDTSSVGRLHRVWSIELPELADERPILAGNLLMQDKKRQGVFYV